MTPATRKALTAILADINLLACEAADGVYLRGDYGLGDDLDLIVIALKKVLVRTDGGR
ncbi:hypothetical protein [Acidiphilium acidophilum]|uniref:hypothetical protein n=1 Tax=Acidiphilium acidophilum TaxID=76588 RepID=UPI002E8E61B3|nr:hypothetical protein [Acidiphilium acidophilum]